MRTLDIEKMWKALTEDRDFMRNAPKETLGPYREMLETLPTLLADRLDVPVTISTLMQAKLDIIEHMLETGFIAKLMTAAVSGVPEAMRPDPEELVEGLKEALTHARMPLMEMIHNTAEFLSASGCSEDELLTSKQCGLSRKSLQAYKRGGLTLGDLLETQPVVFVGAGAG